MTKPMKITKQAVSKKLGRRTGWYDGDHIYHDTRIVVDLDGDLYAVPPQTAEDVVHPEWAPGCKCLAEIDITNEMLDDWGMYGKQFAINEVQALLQEAVDEALEENEVSHE